jgi:hypothetical protein
MVTEPVGSAMMKKVDMNWEEFRKRARLCPECRRKHSAESLALLELKKSGGTSAYTQDTQKKPTFELVK